MYLSSTHWSCSIVPNYELQSFLGSRAGLTALSSYQQGTEYQPTIPDREYSIDLQFLATLDAIDLSTP